MVWLVVFDFVVFLGPTGHRTSQDTGTAKATCRSRTGNLRITNEQDKRVNLCQYSSGDQGRSNADSSSTGNTPSATPREPLPADADLAKIITAWPDLPRPIRRAMVAMIDEPAGED